jgi:hypothetical protein
VKPIVALLLVALLAAGCKDFPGADGRYATPGRGGWDGFRAEAPPAVPPANRHSD